MPEKGKNKKEEFSTQGGPASGWDVAVIGAGPAGIMAAGKAAQLGQKVVLIEKNSSLAKKLLLTGGGRCNFSNAEFNLRELIKNYNHGEFLFHAFSIFGPKETIYFFEKLGIKTKTEKNKRVFPADNSAGEVLEALNKYLKVNRVKVILNSEITGIDKKGNPPSSKTSAGQGKINKLILRKGEITAKKYILCTGGKSYALTGSDGFGYALAEKLGHTIIKPMPTLSPIKIKESWIKDLQGISLKDITVELFQNGLPAKDGKNFIREKGEIIFTHFGVSGPAILNISGKVGELAKNGEVKLHIDMYPSLNQEELFKRQDEIFKRFSKKTVKNVLSDFMPQRLVEVLLDIHKIEKDKMANNMTKAERWTIARAIKAFEATVEDVLGFDQAMVTKGGVSLKEIDHKTMKSKIIDNLYFAGEIIDVNGKTGGFNLQMCWSTGSLAAEN